MISTKSNNFIFAISQEDWNGNVLDLDVSEEPCPSSPGFESCASSLSNEGREDYINRYDQAEDLEAPFFRDRSSSDSVTMGNKSGKKQKDGRADDEAIEIQGSTAGNKANKKLIFLTPGRSPQAVTVQPKPDTDSLGKNVIIDDKNSSHLSSTVHHINKSVTSETLYKDAQDFTEVEDPSSYKEVAHHHTWTVDENLLVPEEEGSDSINVPELPYENESCSLNGIVLEELENVETVPSSCEQKTIENEELSTESPPSPKQHLTPSLSLPKQDTVLVEPLDHTVVVKSLGSPNTEIAKEKPISSSPFHQEPECDASLTTPKQGQIVDESSNETFSVAAVPVSLDSFSETKLPSSGKELEYLALDVLSFNCCSATTTKHILRIYENKITKGRKSVSWKILFKNIKHFLHCEIVNLYCFFI